MFEDKKSLWNSNSEKKKIFEKNPVHKNKTSEGYMILLLLLLLLFSLLLLLCY